MSEVVGKKGSPAMARSGASTGANKERRSTISLSKEIIKSQPLQAVYTSSIPLPAIEQFDREIKSVTHGGVSLIAAIRDGHPTFRIEKTVSIIAGG